MSKFECDLVTDLFPRYIDKKTSEESKLRESLQNSLISTP